MNTKDPKAELQHLLDNLDKEATRSIENVTHAAEKAVTDAKNLLAALEFERALPVGQSAELAKLLKADHTLVGVIDSNWETPQPAELTLQWESRSYARLGQVSLPKGKHRAILFIFEEKA